MPIFSFNIDSLEAGTAVVTVTAGEPPQTVTLYPSYLSDALGDMVDGLLVFLSIPYTAPEIISICWQDEPGEWRWVLRRNGANEDILIQIRRFSDTFSRLPDDRGKVVFETQCTALRLATQVTGQFHHILNIYSEEGYQQRWRHPFPKTSYSRLAKWIALQKELAR